MPETKRVEFIELYIKIGDGDYKWHDNHGELIRCKDCMWNSGTVEKPFCMSESVQRPKDWFCADGERKS